MSLLLLLKPHGPPYHRFLLDTAQRLFESGHYAPPIVPAQLACEIATEQAISAAYRRRGIEDLDEPMVISSRASTSETSGCGASTSH